MDTKRNEILHDFKRIGGIIRKLQEGQVRERKIIARFVFRYMRLQDIKTNEIKRLMIGFDKLYTDLELKLNGKGGA